MIRRPALLTLVLTLLMLSTAVRAIEQETIARGVLDLSEKDLRQGVVAASGQWMFRWNEFVEPRPEVLESVPWTLHEVVGKKAGWNKQDEAGLPARGFGTYRVKITLPQRSDAWVLGMRLKRIKTAARIFINGELVAQKGRVGQSAAQTRHVQSPVLIFHSVAPGEQQLDLVIHVANFMFPRGGIDEILYIGEAKDVVHYREKNLAVQLFAFGVLAFLSAYHLMFFGLWPRNREILVFSLFCFSIAVRMLVTNEKFLANLWPTLSGEWILGIELSTAFFAMPLIHVFIAYLYPREFNPSLVRLSALVSLTSLFNLFFVDIYYYAQLIPLYELYILFSFIVVSVGLYKVLARKRELGYLFAIGFAAIVLTSINDILYERGVIGGAFTVQYGIFVFALCQSVLLGKRFANALERVESANQSLEEEVNKRTQELNTLMQQNRYLNKTNTEIVEKERKTLSSEIHDSFNSGFIALKMHANSILRSLSSDNGKLDKASIMETCRKMISICSDNYAAARRITSSLRPEIIDTLGLESAIAEEIRKYSGGPVDITFDSHGDFTDLPDETAIALFRVVQEATTNIIKHARATEEYIALVRRQGAIELLISDNGRGFDVRSAHSSGAGGGIGLIGMRERIIALNGNFEMQSVPEKGTGIKITVPIDRKENYDGESVQNRV